MQVGNVLSSAWLLKPNRHTEAENNKTYDAKRVGPICCSDTCCGEWRMPSARLHKASC